MAKFNPSKEWTVVVGLPKERWKNHPDLNLNLIGRQTHFAPLSKKEAKDLAQKYSDRSMFWDYLAVKSSLTY